jgi:hypothetical protein
VVIWKQDLTRMKGIKIIKEQLALVSSKFFQMEQKDWGNHR